MQKAGQWRRFLENNVNYVSGRMKCGLKRRFLLYLVFVVNFGKFINFFLDIFPVFCYTIPIVNENGFGTVYARTDLSFDYLCAKAERAAVGGTYLLRGVAQLNGVSEEGFLPR